MFKLKNPTKSLVVLNFAGNRLELKPLQTSGNINDTYKESLLSYVKVFDLELIEDNDKSDLKRKKSEETSDATPKKEVKEEKKDDKVQQSEEKVDEKSLKDAQEKVKTLTAKAEELTKAIDASKDGKEKKSLTKELDAVNAELTETQTNLSQQS